MGVRGPLHFLVPADPIRSDAPDEMFADQSAALRSAGFTASCLPDRALAGAKPLTSIPPGSRVVYRGWMLTGDEYAGLVRAVERSGATMLIDRGAYLTAHHLPNWYPLIADLTPETRVYPTDADIAAELRALGWGAYFLKDYVKSSKTSRGSIVRDPNDAPAVLEEIRDYRGRIEGGICVRRVEDFQPDTEQRFFVLGGVAHPAVEGGEVPTIVSACAGRIPSPFFSVDVVRRRDGVLRVVEVGDGQVSDLVGWTAEAFASVWLRAALRNGSR